MSMERLIVKNFGPIKDVDIEIPRLLVFIGDQASGKSTLGKLIYIFKFVPKAISIVPLIIIQQPIKIDDIQNEISKELKLRFDVCFFKKGMHIQYQFSEGYSIAVSIGDNNTFEFDFSDMLKKALYDLEMARMDYHADKITERDQSHKQTGTLSGMFPLERLALKASALSDKLRDTSTFEYMDASRADTSFPRSFGLYTALLDPSVTRRAMNTFADLLLGVEDIRKTKNEFIKKITDSALPSKEILDSYITAAVYDEQYREMLVHAEKRAELYTRLIRIAYNLVGGYIGELENKGYGVTLEHSSVFVPYLFLSSGQQSVIPLVAGITLCAYAALDQSYYELPFNSAVLEEPETHLYPKKQFELMKLVCAALAINEWSQFIITTHSPYILSSLHALSAYGLVDGDVDALKKYDDLVHLKSDKENLGIYLLENGCAKSLRDEESGLFDTSEIDSVAEEINEVFDESVIAREVQKEQRSHA